MNILSYNENEKNLRKKERELNSNLLIEELNSLKETETEKEENLDEKEENDENNSSDESKCQSLISENDSFTKENKKNMRIILKSKLGEKSILDIAKGLNNAITVK